MKGLLAVTLAACGVVGVLLTIACAIHIFMAAFTEDVVNWSQMGVMGIVVLVTLAIAGIGDAVFGNWLEG